MTVGCRLCKKGFVIPENTSAVFALRLDSVETPFCSERCLLGFVLERIRRHLGD